jgi:hypothetical protein
VRNIKKRERKSAYFSKLLSRAVIKEQKKRGGAAMNQTQLLKQLQLCKHKWNGWGEDVFQEACVIALERYKSLENVNQKLFSLLCKEGARKLLKHKLYEIPFSQLTEEEEIENTIIDPRSLKDIYDLYEAYEAYNEIEDEEKIFQISTQEFFCR